MRSAISILRHRFEVSHNFSTNLFAARIGEHSGMHNHDWSRATEIMRRVCSDIIICILLMIGVEFWESGRIQALDHGYG